MTVGIHYFSGTGNTHDVVQIIADAMRAKGHVVTLVSIEAAEPYGDLPDLTVVAFPVYAWTPPALVMKYVRRTLRAGAAETGVPRSARPRAAVVAVDGGDGGGAAERMGRLLRRRGYDVVRTDRIGYPDNWSQFIQTADAASNAAIVTAAHEAGSKISRGLMDGERSRYRASLGYRGATWFGMAMFVPFGRRFLGQVFAATDACTACGICVRTCPVGAVSLVGGKPHWRLSCQACNRCINICPESAIVTSWTRLVLVFALIGIGSVAGVRAVLAAVTEATLVPGARFLIATAVVLAAHAIGLALAPWLWRALRFIPGGNRFLSATFNASWRRYWFAGFRAPIHRR